MISEIIPIVNLIAIIILFIILFILYFTKKNTENFTGAPSGYTGLLVSDPEGNLDTFSLETLENDINTKISNALKVYTTTADLKADLKANYQPKGNYQPAGSYIKSGQVISMSGYWDGHVGGAKGGDGTCRMLLGQKDGPQPTVQCGHGGPASGYCPMDPSWFNQWVIN